MVDLTIFSYKIVHYKIVLDNTMSSQGGGGWWVGKINNKDHLSPAEAEPWAELGNISCILWTRVEIKVGKFSDKYSTVKVKVDHLQLLS